MAGIPFNSREIMVALEEANAFILQEVGKSVLRTLVFASPVGDPTLWQNPESAPPGYVGGSFRRNWQVGVGSAPQGELPGVDQGGHATIAQGELVLQSEVRGPERTIYVVNNLPYGGRLNDGHSVQAPAGFVEQAVAVAVAGAIPGNRVL